MLGISDRCGGGCRWVAACSLRCALSSGAMAMQDLQRESPADLLLLLVGYDQAVPQLYHLCRSLEVLPSASLKSHACLLRFISHATRGKSALRPPDESLAAAADELYPTLGVVANGGDEVGIDMGKGGGIPNDGASGL
ncbi:hypothetical protein Tco_1563950 [Tanacetum coccineum]